MFPLMLTFPAFHPLSTILVLGKCHKDLLLKKALWIGLLLPQASAANFFFKGQIVNTLGTTSQLSHCGRKAATDSVELNGHDCVPIKFYLLKCVASCIGPLSSSLPNLALLDAVESHLHCLSRTKVLTLQVLGAAEAESSQLSPSVGIALS